MYAEFTSMVIQNFKAFKGKHTLVLNGEGVVFVIGKNNVTRLFGNGAAKSTLWDALTWCLYGCTPLGLRNPDVKPWTGGRTVVTVLIVIDEVEQVIQRSMEPNLLTINGVEHADISSVFPVSLDLFINSIIFPQDLDLFLQRKPSEKMETVSEACDLERWEARSAVASKEAAKFDLEVADFQNEQRNVEGAIEEVDRLLKRAKQDSEEWNDARLERKQSSKKLIAGLEATLKRLQNELDTAVLTEDGALLELRASERKIDEVTKEAREILGDLNEVKASLNSLEGDLERAEEELIELDGAKTCPTCGQPIKASNVREHRAELTERKGELARKIAGKLKDRKSIGVEAAKVTEQLDRIHKDIAGFRERANEASDVVLRLRPEVATKKAELEAQRDTEETNPYVEGIASLVKRRKKLTDDLDAVKSDVEAAQLDAERARFWVKAFKDIKLQLIREVMEELEITANGMIEEVGLEDWRMLFDIERESKSGNIQRKIDVKISSPESGEHLVKWHSWSGGEKQRLKLIGSLALADVLLARAGVETNLQILDEPAVYWSSEGIQELVDFLTTWAKERHKTLFYIEHNAVESTQFVDTLKIVKDKDGAYIE